MSEQTNGVPFDLDGVEVRFEEGSPLAALLSSLGSGQTGEISLGLRAEIYVTEGLLVKFGDQLLRLEKGVRREVFLVLTLNGKEGGLFSPRELDKIMSLAQAAVKA
ncbi:MAG: hypothetical protein ACOYS2_02435 [Patescibacteria group bacterium]